MLRCITKVKGERCRVQLVIGLGHNAKILGLVELALALCLPSGVGTKSTLRGEGGGEPGLLGSWRGAKPLPGHQEFWCILGSSGELSCSPAMQNCVHRPPI